MISLRSFSEYTRLSSDSNDAAAASKILKRQATPRNGEFHEKNGAAPPSSNSRLGVDDSNSQGCGSTVQQPKDAGINVELDARAASEFGEAMSMITTPPIGMV